MDHLTKSKRSWNMSRIRSKDTCPELILRSSLHRLGYRYRLHQSSLPGKPDIVLPKYKAVILVHGCFWHKHLKCKLAATPKSNILFWRKKLDGNVSRDARNIQLLKASGYLVLIVWECQLSNDKVLKIVRSLDKKLDRRKERLCR